MKKKKYLPLYYQWMKDGKMDLVYPGRATGGLCGSSANTDLLGYFFPQDGDNAPPSWWGWEDGFSMLRLESIRHDFTPFRQTILLFMAAINGEL